MKKKELHNPLDELFPEQIHSIYSLIGLALDVLRQMGKLNEANICLYPLGYVSPGNTFEEDAKVLIEQAHLAFWVARMLEEYMEYKEAKGE